MVIRRIVVGLDGSRGSAAALNWCAALAPLLDAEVFAVCAMDAVGYRVSTASQAEIPAIIDESALENTIRAELDAELNVWCAPLQDAGVTFRLQVVEADVIDALLGAAEDVDADLVVVGQEKHPGIGGVKEKLLGSVPNHLVHKCARPVVVVPADPAG